MTPAEYKLAAEQLAKCLWNGIGVINRAKNAALQSGPTYELDGWLAHASALVNKWHESTTSPQPEAQSDDGAESDRK